ncbi:hypothetical protein [Mesorhizobium sp. B2-3-4]|uniref:hypothetical protein n=1 Tax=Mesorhizobium sp. B2-3-4 TaxID=2589959 RepID=UPI001125F198|nr:hypothetical protein [Mesorhizobium sp. B2-3-4]TPM41415.1 hypothetical protein FJ967_00310 [Mesorhizobium sp. B2-3-4]
MTEQENLNAQATADAAAADAQANTEEELDDATAEGEAGADPEQTETVQVEGNDKQEGEGDPAAVETKQDPRDDELAKLKKQLDETNGRVGTERGTRNILQKVVKSLEEAGVVDRDEIAQAVGLDRRRLDGILDAKTADDNDAFMRRCNQAEQQIMAVSSVLKSAGKDADAITKTYGHLLRFDAEERARFMELPEDKTVEHIIARTAEAEGRIAPLVKANGDVFGALSESQQRIAELEAENAALKAGNPSDKPKTGQPQRVPLSGSGSTPAAPAARTGGFYEGL